MGILIGPTPWWQANIVSVCPVGTILPDGSAIICKAGGTAWIVPPVSTQVSPTWNNSTITQVGNKCCVCDWPSLNTAMINAGFNPADWFVPNASQMINPGRECSGLWPNLTSSQSYWTSSESNATNGCTVRFNHAAGPFATSKTSTAPIRAFRCVTY